MRHRLNWFSAGSVFLTLFAGISYLVHKGFFDQLDFDLTVKIQDHLPLRFDPWLSSFSLIGSIEVTAVVFALIFFLSLRKLHRLLVIFWFPFFHVFELLGKLVIFHPGPPFMFLRYTFGFHFPSAYVHTDYSYPSGHVGRTVYLASLLAFLISKSKASRLVKTAAFIFLAGIVGVMVVSRISLGEHWFSDTLGGAVLALAMVFFTFTVW